MELKKVPERVWDSPVPPLINDLFSLTQRPPELWEPGGKRNPKLKETLKSTNFIEFIKSGILLRGRHCGHRHRE